MRKTLRLDVQTGYFCDWDFDPDDLIGKKYEFAVVPATIAEQGYHEKFPLMIKRLLEEQKRIGFFHRATIGDAWAQAENFARRTEFLTSVGLSVLDVRHIPLVGVYWTEQFLDRFTHLTGMKPAIFAHHKQLLGGEWYDLALDGYYPWMLNFPKGLKHPLKQPPDIGYYWPRLRLYSHSKGHEDIYPSALYGTASTWAEMVLGVAPEDFV